MATPTPSPHNAMARKTYRGEKGGKTRVKSNEMKYNSLQKINASTPTTHAQRINQCTALP